MTPGADVHKRRHDRLGGTDSAKVMKSSKYGGPMDVFRDLVHGIRPEIDPFTALRGLLTEDMVCPLAELKYGWKLRRKIGVILDDKRDWAAVSPDAMVPSEDAGLEIKSRTPNMWNEYGEEDSDDVPKADWIQCQAYMSVTGLKKWYLLAYFGGNDLRRFVLRHDPALHRAWEDCCGTFWNECIVPKKAPAIDGSSTWEKVLLEARVPSKEIIDATARMNQLAWLIHERKEKIEALEEEKKLYRNELLQELGSADKIRGADFTFSIVNKASISWSKIGKSMDVPDEIKAQYTSTSTYPMFRWKGESSDE